MIIIGTEEPLEIGSVQEGKYIRDQNRKEIYDNIRFFIVRKATFEEWIEYREKNDLGKTDLPSTVRSFKDCYFYEVHTD